MKLYVYLILESISSYEARLPTNEHNEEYAIRSGEASANVKYDSSTMKWIHI